MAEAGTILFVEDDHPQRQALSLLFERAGFFTWQAANGTQALELAWKHRPDLVVLDVNLPDLSGFEVCRRIKESAAPPAPLVVLTSAVYVGSDDRTQGLEGGADAYLVKPVEPRELLATLRALQRIRTA